MGNGMTDYRAELRTQAGRAAYEAVREVEWYGVRDRFPSAHDLMAYVGERLLELERQSGHRTGDAHDCFLMNCRDLGVEG
jgi:hypothetical protein